MALVLATRTETADITTLEPIGATFTPDSNVMLAAHAIFDSLDANAAELTLQVSGTKMKKVKGKRKPADGDTLATIVKEPFFIGTASALTFSVLSSNSNDTTAEMTISILEGPVTASGTIATVTNVGTVTGNVDGSVASVSGAVGSVTGAVGSVTGAVGSVAGNVDGSTASVTAGVTLANDAITSAKYDETSAFPVKSADTGSTKIAREGADSDTMKDLSDQIDDIPTAGAGAVTFVYTCYKVDGSTPLSGCDIWVTTDQAGSNTVASGVTNTSGQVTVFLDAGTMYFWRQHPDFTFTNPDSEVVSGS